MKTVLIKKKKKEKKGDYTRTLTVVLLSITDVRCFFFFTKVDTTASSGQPLPWCPFR